MGMLYDKLWKRVMIGLLLGVGFGLGVTNPALLGPEAGGAFLTNWVKPVGDLFVRLIKMIVVPLVFTTLVAGVVGMGDPKRLGSIGVKAIATYLLTTAIAISIGLAFGIMLEPGAGVDLGEVAAADLGGEAQPLADRLFGIVPLNPIEALANGDILAIIFFAMLFGVGIVMAGDKARTTGAAIEGAAEAILKITTVIMELAPYGVFALIAWVAGTKGAATLLNIATLAATVYGACLLHLGLVYGGLVRFVANLPVIGFFRSILDPQLVAYSTSSSSATLPVTLATAEADLGIKPAVASSVLPLGATINMDGTALYIGIVAVFAAQVFGISLDLNDYLLIALTTTLASIGTAGIPSASLFLLATVLEVIDISPAQTALIVGFILPFDRLLDMMRTMVNVSGDLTVATLVG
ncbi:MAG: dicarboxylate/amino acid:cation symporter, partial [Pseudomonadota bacterium]